MTSEEIVNLWGIKRKGQQLLFEDYDNILRNTKFISNDDVEINKQILIHWWMNVYAINDGRDFDVPYEVYKSWSNAIGNNFKFIMMSGYHTISKQTIVSLACSKHLPLEPQLEELKLWLPHIIPTKNDKDKRESKYISIFEHNLSKDAIISLSIYSDTDISVNSFRYGQHKVLCPFDNIRDAVEYIWQNFWYRNDNDNSEDYD